MSAFQPIRRATLLVPSGPAHDIERHHLFILLTDPTINPENQANSVLLTSLSTLSDTLPCDLTCILHIGDHPFIKHDSYVHYRGSLIKEVAKLLSGVASGQLIAKELLDVHLVDKICDGLLVSKQTPEKIKRFYRTYLNCKS